MPRISSLLKPVLEHPSLENVRLHLAQGDSSRKDAHEPPPDHDAEPLCLEGLTRTAKALALAALGHRLERPIIVLTSDNENAERLRSVTATFLHWLSQETTPDAVALLPAYDCSPYQCRSPHAEIAETRAVTLWAVARGLVRILIAPAPAALGRFRDRIFYRSLAVELGPSGIRANAVAMRFPWKIWFPI